MDNKKNSRFAVYRAYFPYILLLLLSLILLIRAFYSFCSSDEPFYFSTAYRFFRGDSIFRHDWFPTQLSGVILLPFLSLFINCAKGTEGVLLFFRILYLIFSLMNAFLAFSLLKRHKSRPLSFSVSVCVLFYAHLNIATLSYYTISVQCFFSAMLLIYHSEKLPEGDKRGRFLIPAGILYALSVLALPTMALGYLLTVICLTALLLWAGPRKAPAFNSPGTGALREAVQKARLKELMSYTFIGILIPAVGFFIFLLFNVPIKDFIANIPFVLSDEEHGTSLIYPLKKFFIGINMEYGAAAFAGYLLIVVSFFLDVLLRIRPRLLKELKREDLSRPVFAVDTALFIMYFIKSYGHTGYIQTALCLFSLPLFFMTEKKDLTAFFTFFVNGMVFSLVYSYSSNGYLYILSMGHFIASAAGMIFVADFCTQVLKREIPGPAASGKSAVSTLMAGLCIVVLSVTVLQTAALRIVNVYRDAPLPALTARIERGPGKGLYTTPGHLRQYEEVMEVLTEYANAEVSGGNDMLFISKLLPWGYLVSDLRTGAPTTWRTELGSDRLREYYSLNPDRIPSVVLVLDKEYGSYDTCGDVVADPIPNLSTDSEGFLPDYMKKNGYRVIPVACGTLFLR